MSTSPVTRHQPANSVPLAWLPEGGCFLILGEIVPSVTWWCIDVLISLALQPGAICLQRPPKEILPWKQRRGKVTRSVTHFSCRLSFGANSICISLCAPQERAVSGTHLHNKLGEKWSGKWKGCLTLRDAWMSKKGLFRTLKGSLVLSICPVFIFSIRGEIISFSMHNSRILKSHWPTGCPCKTPPKKINSVISNCLYRYNLYYLILIQ